MLRQSRQDRAAVMINARNTAVLEAAIIEAKTNGYQWITRKDVANRAKVARATVSNAFGTMVELKRAVLRAAVNREILEIVAQGLADRHEIALNAQPDVRERAAALITN